MLKSCIAHKGPRALCPGGQARQRPGRSPLKALALFALALLFAPGLYPAPANAQVAGQGGECDTLQATLSRERAGYIQFLNRLEELPDDLKARLRDAGISPGGAFDSAQRQGFRKDIFQAWDELDDKAGSIFIPFAILACTIIFILILALLDRRAKSKIQRLTMEEGLGRLNKRMDLLMRRSEALENLPNLLKEAGSPKRQDELEKSLAEYSDRMDEIARKIDEISSGAIKNYMKEILNRLEK